MEKFTEEYYRNNFFHIRDNLIKDQSNIVTDKDDEKIWSNIFSIYTKIHNYIHRLVYKEDFLMDRHKIAASFMIAIININPLIYRQTTSDFPNTFERTSNEQLGFIFGLFILYRFYKEDAKKENSPIKIWISTNTPTFPKCKKGIYMTHLVSYVSRMRDKLILTKSEYDKNYTFHFANMYYFIDKYSEKFYLLKACKDKQK